MPRIARYIEPNGYYHVISRSINDTWILKDQEDFIRFCYFELKAKEQFPIQLYHYALMNTHFHFVLKAFDKESLAKHLSYLKWHYTKWVKKKYGWKGPLWRERYKSLPIENESYLTICGTYVEYNPVRAGICNDPAEYLYSSYRKYHLDIKDALVDEYEITADQDTIRKFNFKTSEAKNIFSRLPAIGNLLFVEKYRSSR